MAKRVLILDHAPAAQIRERFPAARVELIRTREDAALTRPQLARRLGVARAYLFRVEMGTRDPSIELMHRWAEALDAPFAVFGLDAAASQGERVRSLLNRIIERKSLRALGAAEEALFEIAGAA